MILAFNISFYNSGAQVQITGEGTPGYVALWVIPNQPLGVVFTVTPNSGPAPLATTFQAVVSGGPLDTINYSFWWNCANVTTSVGTAEADPACGDLPVDPPGGGCTTNSYGAKCDAENATTMSVPHIYSANGNYTAKVIIERGAVAPIQDQEPVTVSSALSVSCSANKATAAIGEEVIWSTVVSGGTAPYTYDWSGSSPPLDARSGPIESIFYNTSGVKTGQVRVESSDGQDTGIVSCSGSVDILPTQITFTATPPAINPGDTSILAWDTTGFTSCGIVDDDGNIIFPTGPTVDGSTSVSPTTSTEYTLTCDGLSGSQSANVTVAVAGAPIWREVPPSGGLYTPFEFAAGILNKLFDSEEK